MKTLPDDASDDQTGNIPQGYYRRNGGMLHMIPQADQSPAVLLSSDDMAKLDQMSREELLKLVHKVSRAGWGYGKLTGKELLETALKSKEDAYEALKLTALTFALNAKEWREFHALASFWAEREKGKPQQSVDVTGKIGIIEIVMEASKLRESSKAVIIDNTTL